MFLNNRVVLEGLFRKVAVFFEKNATVANRTTSLRSALEASSMEINKRKIICGMRAMMATINEALQNDAISVATAQLFPLTGVRYEHMSSILLYSDVATAVYLPNFKDVFISTPN